jgi:hypothetical protein
MPPRIFPQKKLHRRLSLTIDPALAAQDALGIFIAAFERLTRSSFLDGRFEEILT